MIFQNDKKRSQNSILPFHDNDFSKVHLAENCLESAYAQAVKLPLQKKKSDNNNMSINDIKRVRGRVK